MNKFQKGLAATAFALSPAFALAEQAAQPSLPDIQQYLATPHITMTMKNTYDGETYDVTSETWSFENRCDHYDWLAAFGYIVATELKDYEVGYSGLAVDVTISSRSGITTYSDLSAGDVLKLFSNSPGYRGDVLERHAADLLPDACLMVAENEQQELVDTLQIT